MNDLLSTTFLVGLIAATLRVATPLVFGTVGEVITERAGILNLGIEGIMFLGAFVGFAAAAKAEAAGIAGYLWIGLLAAVVSGLLMALLMGLLTVTLGLNQHVSGLGITLLATALSLFGFRVVFGESSVLPSIDPFPQLAPQVQHQARSRGCKAPDIGQGEVAQPLLIEGRALDFGVVSCHAPFLCHTRVRI